VERLDKLASLIQDKQDDIVGQWRARVRQMPTARDLDKLTLEDSIRPFLDAMSNALIAYMDGEINYAAVKTAPLAHGFQRFGLGFNITQVVKEYNILRQTLLDFAEAAGLRLDGEVRRALHGLLDEAVASAVDTFASVQAREHESRVQERLLYVVHDLKTPLSAIHTASLLLEKRLSEESHKRVAPMLAVILRNCDHVNTMLMKLLEDKTTSAAILHAELVRGEVPLYKVAEEVVADLRPLAERTGVKMQNAVPTNLALNADPFLCKQVLQNLVSNALKYTNQGTITLGGKADEGEVSFWVSDTGIGMSEEKLRTLFSDAVADPAHASSSGMGLTIVKRIAEAHGGKVLVESAPHKGTTVTVVLPG